MNYLSSVKKLKPMSRDNKKFRPPELKYLVWETMPLYPMSERLCADWDAS